MSVAGVIVDEQGRALLIQRRDNGHWEPPGGILEPEEAIPEALHREVLEETGVSIALPAALTGVYKNMTGLVVSLVFRCEAVDGTPTPGDETRALRWATRAEVTALAIEAYAIRVLDALDATSPPAVRAHDGVNLV
ncbi:NUDIX domain-containing protein [Streptomyces atriruber]|uniref:NUDIX domain-containing protein n=1 Tax=Streptomyces atriruber TaxID=545121 RepID=A0ABV3BUD5_9ACTN